MTNFSFFNPTKIIFGKKTIESLKEEVPKGARVLVTFGGGSIKENGVYDQVKSALSSFQLMEFGGIEPNPTYETLMKAVQIVKRERIDFLLAVGGGSVIDGTKFIAAASLYEGKEPWDILAKGEPIQKAIPFGTILTLPATGSEMNSGSVISRQSLQEKLFFSSSVCFPKFSILDPTTTYTLPKRQIINGIVDAFVHTTEQYLTYPSQSPLQDRFAESILRTLIEEGPKALNQPENYDVRANIMWCATMALNGLIGSGVPQDWTTHMIGHEITAIYGLDHAQTLAVVLPSVLRIRKKQKQEKLLQYADQVWGIRTGSSDERIDKAIETTENFFRDLGAKTRLSEYEVGEAAVQRVLDKLSAHGMNRLGETRDIDLGISEQILKGCLHL
jgi:NADP-dependent alcohol dehydrogenase